MIRLVIAVLLLGFVLSRVDWKDFRSIAADADRSVVFLGYLMNLLMVLVNTIRWRLLVSSLGTRVRTIRLMSYYFVCMFFNNFMPTSIGGDVMRVIDLSQHTGKKASAMASIMVERLLGLYVLLPICLAAFVALYPVLPERRLFLLAEVGIGILFFVGTLMIRRRNVKRMERLLKPLAPLLERIDAKRRVSQLYDYLDFYKGRKQVVLSALLLSLLSRSIWVFSCWVLGRAIGIDLTIYHFFLLMPLVEVGRMIPVSLNGVGIREGVMVVILGLFGVGNAKAVFLSLLIYGIFIINGFLGGVWYGVRGFFQDRDGTGESSG